MQIRKWKPCYESVLEVLQEVDNISLAEERQKMRKKLIEESDMNLELLINSLDKQHRKNKS